MAHRTPPHSRQLPTPSSSPATQREQPARHRNRLEAWSAQNLPGYTPPTDDDILCMYRGRSGWTNASPAKCFEHYNRRQDEMLDRSGGALHMIGGPPAQNETDIYIYHVPDSPVSIRIWAGGMARYGQYCLEYFDPGTHRTVNTPRGFELHGLARPGQFQYHHPLVSWERAFNGDAPILEGCEKYSVPEGSHWRLTRPGREDFLFSIPTRPALYQFNAPTPYVRPV